MIHGTPDSSATPSARIEALRLKVKAAVLIGVARSVMQEYMQELHALTLLAERRNPGTR